MVWHFKMQSAVLALWSGEMAHKLATKLDSATRRVCAQVTAACTQTMPLDLLMAKSGLYIWPSQLQCVTALGKNRLASHFDSYAAMQQARLNAQRLMG